jgi:hypothetical protein
MTRKYDFSSALMSGKADASAKTRWWPRHSRAMSRYVTMSPEGDGAALKSVRELLMMGATEWEVSICRSSHPSLMTDHAAFEIALIDAGMRKDVTAMEASGQRLLENAKAQVEFYTAKAVETFPAGTFYGLLVGHVKLFMEAAHYHMAREERKFQDCEERRERNTLSLAAFTAEWL